MHAFHCQVGRNCFFFPSLLCFCRFETAWGICVSVTMLQRKWGVSRVFVFLTTMLLLQEACVRGFGFFCSFSRIKHQYFRWRRAPSKDACWDASTDKSVQAPNCFHWETVCWPEHAKLVWTKAFQLNKTTEKKIGTFTWNCGKLLRL